MKTHKYIKPKDYYSLVNRKSSLLDANCDLCFKTENIFSFLFYCLSTPAARTRYGKEVKDTLFNIIQGEQTFFKVECLTKDS